MPESGEGPWHDTVPLADLWIGEMRGLDIAGVNVLLVNVDDDEVHAYLDRCPHRSSRLSEGKLEGVKLTCATHLWEFDARRGCGINPATSRLTEFPCRVAEGMIQVRVPEPGAIPQAGTRERSEG